MSKVGRLIDANTLEHVKIVHIVSLSEFYVCDVSINNNDAPAHSSGRLIYIFSIESNFDNYSTFQMAEISRFDEVRQDLNRFYANPYQEQLYELHEKDICVVRHRGDWYRGCVLSIATDRKSVSVRLVDFGDCITVPSNNLRVIDASFVSFGPLSFPCRLAAINNDEALTEKTLVLQLKSICKNAGAIQIILLTDQMPCLVRILVSQNSGDGSNYTDAYILSPSYAVLAVEQIHCKGIEWFASNMNGKKLCYNSAKNKKFNIIVTSIQSPTEIYVSTHRADEQKRKMHAAIQRWASQHQTHELHDIGRQWKQDDRCLVHVRRAHNIKMWYRGIVVKLVSGNELQVFLRDIGDVVTVHPHNLTNIDEKYLRMRDSVLKCHLDGVNNWLNSSMSILQSLVDTSCYASFAPQMNGSVPITLWRPTAQTSCGQIVEWMNINRWLVSATVIEVTEIYIRNTREKFQMDEYTRNEDNDLQYPEHLDFLNILDDDDLIDPIESKDGYDDYDEEGDNFRMSEPVFYELNEWTEGEVEHWLPSVPINYWTFMGTPVFIDNNCVLYVHDAYRSYLANHLSAAIQRIIDNDDNVFDPFAVHWTVGQTCFAKYDGDGKFHRATIRGINHTKCICLVKFIDYGNCDQCKFENMRRATAFGHIPILVRKYCLDNVAPISTHHYRWPLCTLIVCQAEIIDKLCMVYVKETANRDIGILPCKITRTGSCIDLKTLLIEHELCYERTSIRQHRR